MPATMRSDAEHEPVVSDSTIDSIVSIAFDFTFSYELLGSAKGKTSESDFFAFPTIDVEALNMVVEDVLDNCGELGTRGDGEHGGRIGLGGQHLLGLVAIIGTFRNI